MGDAVLPRHYSRLWVTAIALAGISVAPGNGAVAQVLSQELRGLVETHPAIRSKQKSAAAADEGINAARSGYLPTVRVTGDTGPEYVDSPTRRSTEGHAFYKGRETAGLTVTQHLFDGFATDASVDTAKARRALADSELRAARQTALLEGVLAYVDVLRRAKQIELSRENERKVLEQLNLEDERVEKGAGMATDVLAAKQRLQTAKGRRLGYEGDFNIALAKYTQVFGHGPDLARMSDPPVPADLIPPELEHVIRSAEADNPTLESRARTADVYGETRRIAEAGYYPTVDLVGKANYENDKNATLGVRRDWSLLLTATWELFSGFKTDAQVAQASFDYAARKDDYLDTSRRVTEAAKTSWHKLRTARERMGVLEQAANLAAEVWEGAKKKREAGKATVQDVLDEETRTNDALIDYTVAYYDMIQASYELLAAMGRLEVDNVERAPANRAGAPVTIQPVSKGGPKASTLKPSAAIVPPPAPRPAVPAPVAMAVPVAAPVAAPAPVLPAEADMHGRVQKLMAESEQPPMIGHTLPRQWYE